jgi:hypothetical protein
MFEQDESVANKVKTLEKYMYIVYFFSNNNKFMRYHKQFVPRLFLLVLQLIQH